MAKRDPIEGSPQATFTIHQRSLARLWGTGLISTDETLGCLLAYLVRHLSEQAAAATPKPSALQAGRQPHPVIFNTMVRQLGETFEALTGGDLDLWRVEGLWFWRWEDTRQQTTRGLASYSEALADALEQRYPSSFVVEEVRG
ncbi:MAG: hypothetical protein OHK0022_33950 [Roseiflexaceae bacterium]